MAEQRQMSPEQVADMQEKIKNMSPDELREFQKQQCIFCHIVSGKVQSKKIYDDDDVLAILDINPANPGHVLVLPKEHYAIMPQLSAEEIAHVFMVVKTISNACLRALGVQGTNIVVQNGVAAGQKAQHFMVHVIPRQDNDGLAFEVPQKQMKEEDLDKVRKVLAAQLGQKPGSVAGLKPVAKKDTSGAEVQMEKSEVTLGRVQEPAEVVVDKQRLAGEELPSEADTPEEIAEDDSDGEGSEGDGEEVPENSSGKSDKEPGDFESSGEDSEDIEQFDKQDSDEESGVDLDDISRLLSNG